MNPKPKKLKPVKAWGVFTNGNLFMRGENEARFWARIIRTRRQAKDLYPIEPIIPVLITPILPKAKRGTNKPRTKK